MEAFQPFLIALLALNLAVFVPLLVRKVRERLGRTRDQQVIEAATPLMLARLAAIRGGPVVVAGTPSDAAAMAPGVSTEALPAVALAVDGSDTAAITASPGPAAVVTARPEAVPSAIVVATPRAAPDIPQVMASRRRVWRDASAALVVFACVALIVVIALPEVGRPTPTAPATAIAAVA
ncbi:MAG TPA: hypothetical protein VMT36_02390, partial [Candidatus Saccharimonadia bacterium]|nr:hypothetical protein [Candidatus Saccharimonadia bacterium]